MAFCAFVVLLTVCCIAFPSILSAQSFLPVYQKGSGIFEVDLIIGGDMDDDEYFFFGPRDLEMDSRGNLFVLDSRGYCIKKFDPDGIHLKTFSRRGEGPGEIAGAASMEIDPDDNVVVLDVSNHRFSFFDNDGAYLQSVSLSEMGFDYIQFFQIDSKGNFFVEIHEQDFMDPHRKTLVKVSRFSMDTLKEAVVDSIYIKKWFVKTSKQRTFSVTAPFYPEMVWGIAPSGNIVIAHSEDYALKIFSPDLSLLSEGHFGGEKPKVTKEDEEDYFGGFRRGENIDDIRKMVEFPKYKPYFEYLFIDPEGYILIQREESEGENHIYDVFTPKGEFLKQVDFLEMHNSSVMIGEAIYKIKIHDDENPAVYRYRLKQE